MATATLGTSFKCVFVNGLSRETISTIRSACQPHYTDNEDDRNDQFNIDSVLQCLADLEDDPTYHPDGLSSEEYRSAINELEAVDGLSNFDYMCIGSVD